MKNPTPISIVQVTVRVVLLFALFSGFVAPPNVQAASAPESAIKAQLSFPAEINKEFTPISIPAGGISRLSITIFNPNTFQLTNAAWLDNLIGVQPGISISNPVNLTNTCGGTVVAPAGGTSLSLSGGTVPPQVGVTPGSCTVSFDVTSTTPGNLINTIPAGGLTGSGGGGTITNTTPASATLRVDSVQSPVIGKMFNPNTMWVGQTSQLTIGINNIDPTTPLTQVSLTDNLPANVILATPVSPILNGCGGSASLTAVSGTSTITLNNGTIAPNSVCLITVNVTSTVPGTYTNTIPVNALDTAQGVSNQGPASAPLNVQGVGLAKSFSPPNFEAGGITTLTITLQNPTASPLTGVNLSDTLPGTVLTVVPGSATTTCGGTVSTTLPRTVTLTGGTIPAGSVTTPGTCTITVQVTAPPGASGATFTNTIPAGAMTTDQGITNILPASAPVSVYATGAGVDAQKSFTPSTIQPGENSLLTITITAPADTDLTNFSIVDNLPANVTISNSSPPTRSASCGASSILTAVTGGTSISLTNGTILAGTTCQINVYVTSSVAGVYTNTINPADISNNEGQTLPGPITADLTVQSISDLSVSKVFTPDTVAPNGISLLTITLTNTNSSPLINVSLLDNLPGTPANGVVVAPTPNAATTCGSGVVTAVAGTQTISMTGGTIPAQVGGVPGICTITLNVQGRGFGASGTNVIPIANVSGTIQGTTTVINPIEDATAPFTITDLTIGVVKGFNPLTVFGGSASTMSVELDNHNNAELVGIAFTDTMPAGMIIANPPNPNVGTCGGTIIAVPGANSFSFSGGSLPANQACTLTLSVTMTVNGNLTNVIGAGAVTTTNGADNPQAAEASLTNLPGASLSKFFSPNPINAGEYSLLTITIQNTGNIPLTGMGLMDTLPGTPPAGVAVAGAPAPAPVNNCGGTLTAVAGTQLIQLVNGSLAASSSCTIVVSVTGATPGSYQNIIPPGSLTSNEGATNNTPATDTLVIRGAPSGLTKAITSTSLPSTTGSNVAIGEILTYQVDVVIPPGTYANAVLVDSMERGLAFVGCDNIDAPGLTTDVAGSFASVCSNPTTSDGGGGTPMDVDRQVTFNFGTLTNPGQSDATLTVTYRAIVLDIGSNTDGTVLNNSVSWNWSGGSIGPAQTTVTVVEPELTISKTADVNFIAVGSEVTFTLTLAHTQASNSDAYDVVVRDALPVGLDYVPNSLDCTTGAQDPDVECVFDNTNPAQPAIRAAWSVFTRNGGTGVIRFRAVGNSSIPPSGSVTNTATAEWTSLPGDQTTPQSLTPNIFSTERFYDPGDLVNIYSTSTSLTLTRLGTGGGGGGGGGNNNNNNQSNQKGSGGFIIPLTGFAPNVVTELDPVSRPAYGSTALTIEIPSINVTAPIVGVQLKDGNWNVSWLLDQAGWLEGTAYPTWSGNSVITAHAVNADGKPGLFTRLDKVRTGNYIFVYQSGYRYTYQVVSNRYVKPNEIKVLQHEDKPYITLVTCDTYDEKTGTYLRRVVVRAVLIDVSVIK